jgi:Cu+-exporting ATPase
MSVMVGTGRGALEGVLIKDGEALEVLAGIDTLVVDKTGTLTEGRPVLEEFYAVAGFVREDVLAKMAAVERSSEHPLAGAVATAAESEGVLSLSAESVTATPGGGVGGAVGGEFVLVGTASFLRENGIDTGPLDGRYEEMSGRGRSVVFAAIDGKIAAAASFTDPVKATSEEVLRALEAEGVSIVMATGDGEKSARAVAEALRIKEFYAGVRPEGKRDAVVRLMSEGKTVAMAGDGVNDAPALAAAHVGIAMGTGTDVAMESAGVTLVQGDLRGILRAIRLSRATLRNIRQNLFFAFVYNALGVPIAGGALYPFFGVLLSPMIAGAAMSLSSVSVIANALRLRTIRL